MEKDNGVKQLVKILIGAAWLDGRIQPEEREYLHKVATEKGVAADPEVQPLLNEFRTVQSSECYEWVREYLGDHPDAEACQELIEAISGIIYRDGEVATEEAKLLSDLQSMNATDNSPQTAYSSILKEVQTLYRRWINTQS